MAAYPSAIASNADLIVADDRKSTTLLGSISAGVTTIVVTSGVFSDYSVITIENERILLGTASVSGTYINCIRGYDNSTAAAHTTGVTVSANVVAAHHNVLRTEIQAIETALGANLSFVSKVFNASGFTFSFAGTTNLTGSTPASVVITPGPAGITAASVNAHYLYITDGGSSEAVLLTSVSVGASSTTVGFTPANSHTAGQWTLGSATEGSQEAIKYAEAQSGGGAVQLPRGSVTLKERSFIAGTAPLDIFGSREGTVLNPGAHAVFVNSSASKNYSIRNFGIVYVAGSGGTALSLGASTASILVDNVACDYAAVGISLNTSSSALIQNCRIIRSNTYGLVGFLTNNVTIANNFFDQNGQTGTGYGIGLSRPTNTVIIGNTCTNTTGTAQDYGISVGGTTVTNLVVVGNNLTNNNVQNFEDAATTRTRWIVENNAGITTTAGALTAAATVTLPTSGSKVIVVTGTTTVDTINGAWGTGHEIILICPSGLTFSAAGNIASAVTTTFASQVVRGVYESTAAKWYLYA